MRQPLPPLNTPLPELDAGAILAGLMAVSPDPMVVSEYATGRFHRVNPAFERMCGYAEDELRGRTAHDIDLWVGPKARERYAEQLRGAGGQVHQYGILMRSRDGRVVPLKASASIFEQGGVRYVVAVLDDITEHERGRLQHEAILENAMVGIAFTRDRVFQHTNPRFEAMFGWPRGGLVGLPTTAIWQRRADYEALRDLAVRRLFVGEIFEHEMQMERRDGSRFWGQLRARAIDLDDPVGGGAIWIVDDISHRRQLDQALAAAKEQAESANRAKSAFLANTSHEIRTPLNGLLGLARLAVEPDIAPERQREYLERIHESAQALAGTISDILDFSKIEAGRMLIERVTFDLHATIDGVAEAHAALARAKGLGFRVTIADGVPRWVHGDPLRLRQIVGNFLGNALKFTHGGVIEVFVRRAGKTQVRVAVHDTGLGISAAVLPKLFQPFSQADTSTTRRFGGTGLGLSICRELAGLMGGEVGVDSVLGEGSIFWTELPLPESEPRSEPVDTSPVDIDALEGARLLLVEDNPINTLVAEAMLRQWGAEVTLAENGIEAVEAVRRCDGGFDAVLMDLQMPVMNGFQAASLIREDYPAERLPIVALTADALLSDREAALVHGMNDFLSKPIDPDRLARTLARWVTAGRRARVA